MPVPLSARICAVWMASRVRMYRTPTDETGGEITFLSGLWNHALRTHALDPLMLHLARSFIKLTTLTTGTLILFCVTLLAPPVRIPRIVISWSSAS
jgi:hypothetical protein